MYVGIGLFMLVLGAILRYAVNFDIQGVNIHTIGYILMVGGGLALVISLVTALMRRQSRGYSATHTQTYDPRTNTNVERTDVDPY